LNNGDKPVAAGRRWLKPLSQIRRRMQYFAPLDCEAPMNETGQFRHTYDAGQTAVDQGWTGAVRDIFTFEPDGALNVAIRFLRAPVATILMLANDEGYTGYWKFMLACMGAHLTFLFVLVPRFGALVFHLPAANRGAESLTIQGLQLAGFPILTMIQYYICQAFGSISHPPRAYAKLCALSVGYGWLLTLAASILELCILIGIIAAGATVDPVVSDTIQVSAVMFASLVFIALSHRQFWGMTWPRTLAFTVILALLSWVIVYPGLSALATRMNVTERINTLLN
jgi:hypothetical protein